jgi:hypothetical protein
MGYDVCPDIPPREMRFKNIIEILAGLSLILISLPSQAEIFSVIEAKPASEVWLNAGAYSYHFQRDKGFNSRNYGLGAEYRFSTVSSIMAGAFHNSDWYTSHYLVWHWRPIGMGPVRLGALAGAMDGYPHMLDGGWFFAAIPTIDIDYNNVGATLLLIPSYQNRLHGAISLQLRLRVF